MNIYEKLHVVQTSLKAPKNQHNDFGKYYYRSCEDIQEGVKPLLEKTKTILIVGDQLVQIGDRYYIEATATFIDTETGERIENTAYAREEQEKKGMDCSQVTGAASSYARKYALNGLFCIDDVKDADTSSTEDAKKNNTQGFQSKQSKKIQQEKTKTGEIQQEKISENEILALKAKIEEAQIDETLLLSFFKINQLADLYKSSLPAATKKLQVTIDTKKLKATGDN